MNKQKFNPKVSIVIPVYNGSNYMRDAIDSALSQTYRNIEVIVVNDGSQDDGETEKIAKSYGKKIRYYWKENGGVASALNFGIRQMKGEYFSWLSHDDIYYPNKVERQIDYLRGNPDKNIILYADYDLVDKALSHLETVKLDHVKPEHFRYYITTQNALHECTLLIPRSCFLDQGLFNESLKTTQDYERWFGLSGCYSFIHMREVLVQSRQHAQQGSVEMLGVALREINELYIAFVDSLSEQEIVAATNKSIGLSYLDIANSFRARGYYSAERHALKKSLACLSVKTVLRDRRLVAGAVKNIVLLPIYAFAKHGIGRGIELMKKPAAALKKTVVSGNVERKFKRIYSLNFFGGVESKSGSGSDLEQTKCIRSMIPQLIEELQVKTLLDAPCGDFYWMREVDLKVEKYIGADIIPDLISINNTKYKTAHKEFIYKNIIKDPLPEVDLILCRDCLVHLTFDQAIKAIKNFKKSGSKYLLTTTFTGRSENVDLGNEIWRTLNLELPPFNLPKPKRIINEKCTEFDGIFKDKSLGLWALDDIKL